MKIKRFFAAEMREAIRQVKDELGADAVILSNNKVDGGIELVAAIDYDEAAVHRSLDAQTNTRQQAVHSQHASSRTIPQQQDRTLAKKKKRSIFAKIKKQKNQGNLADSIKDDVINFSHHAQPESQTVSQTPQAPANRFADLLKQSGNTQLTNKQSAGIAAASVSNEQSKIDHAAYSQPSIQDRKQPFISDFDDFENNEMTEEDSYPFDYESLLKEQQNRSQDEHTENADSFFRTNKQHKKKVSSRQKSRNDKSGKIEWVQDPALTSMQEEIKSMRGILENQLSGLAWGSFSRNHPHHAELLSRLYRLGIKSSLSEKIVKQLKPGESDSLEDSWRNVLSIIAKNIPMLKHDLLDDGGIIALVGPTGVGKTTNIAKLAARFTLKYGAKNLALVTTDSYRVGAHEQLKTYGRILGVPVYIANDEYELKQVLSRLDDKQLVLIDTAGMSHRDLRLAQQLTMLRHSHEKIKVLAVLSASTQTMAMDEVIKTFDAGELDGCIASKVDESTSIGGIISILIENKLQLNYISNGQKVPEDIHRANTTDLLKQALEMVRQHPVSVNNDELAMSYSGGGLSHAVG